MSPFISPEKLSGLIGQIYDCALDPERWPQAMQAICEELNLRTGVISVIDMMRGEPLLASTTGFSPQWLQRLPEFSDGLVGLWGGERAVRNLPLEEPAVLSRVNPSGVSEDSEDGFHLGFNRPQGFVDAIAVGLTRDDTMLGTIGFNRHEDFGLIGPRETEVMRLLLPHLQRSVAISRVLEIRRIETDAIRLVLNSLSVPVFVVGSGFQLRFANDAGEALAVQKKIVSIQGGCARFDNAQAQRRLASLMQSFTQVPANRSEEPFGTAFRDHEHKPWVVHLLPLSSRVAGNIRSGDDQMFALLLSGPSPADSAASLEALALLYDLTVAETRVFRLLCAGVPSGRIAEELSAAPSTIKTHTLRIYEKTGLHRQSDLVALAGSLAPVRPVGDESGGTGRLRS